jgi:hypothetical protein
MTRVVVRKCRVCEWHGVSVDRGGKVVDCPWCHAPTRVLRSIAASQADPDEKNPHAAALGRLGGLKGGPARAALLSARRRRAIASLAAKARWQKVRKSKD